MRRHLSIVTFAALSVVGLAVSCSSGDSAEEQVAAPVTGSSLSESVTVDAVVGHLQSLSDIAAANDGNRAAGTSGYDASVDYVAQTLRDAGFEVQTPEFQFDSYTLDSVAMRALDREIAVDAFVYSPATPDGGVSGQIVAAPNDETPGCEATDYEGLDVQDAVVLVPRGVCPFAQKAQIAAESGAAAVVVTNNEDGPLNAGTLGSRDAARIPTVGVSREDGAALAAAPGIATITIAAESETTVSRNVLAQTRTGSTDDIVMAGAHLDSVPEGPGINDNGSGVASVLESAVQMGGSPDVTNAVRFAFWGAEELGLVGSTEYVEGLSDADRSAIALYLNFDMVGSNNAGYLVYDGDDSDQTGEPAGPRGSDAIERVFAQQLAAEDAEGTDFDGRSDYGPFIEVGIPSGGVFSGADESKSQEQADKWGGVADLPFDPNYHTEQDTLENVDRDALATNARAVAYGIGTYAESVTGPDGVPVGADREAERQSE
ncbi:MAG: M28 family peptidase [Rhodococcus sp. (in: high G+C Gram-positive bacteria)]